LGKILLNLLLGAGAGLAVGAGVTAGAAGGGDGGPDVSRPSARYARTVKLHDGLYRLADGAVTCTVVKGWIACSNGRVQILCLDDRCKPHYLDLAPEPYAIGAAEEASSARKVLPPDTTLLLPAMTCTAGRHHIECRVADYRGGFQMSGLFARNIDWDDAPPGWPWDGRAYTIKDRVPGI
jgi:hypothetical protein